MAASIPRIGCSEATGSTGDQSFVPCVTLFGYICRKRVLQPGKSNPMRSSHQCPAVDTIKEAGTSVHRITVKPRCIAVKQTFFWRSDSTGVIQSSTEMLTRFNPLWALLIMWELVRPLGTETRQRFCLGTASRYRSSLMYRWFPLFITWFLVFVLGWKFHNHLVVYGPHLQHTHHCRALDKYRALRPSCSLLLSGVEVRMLNLWSGDNFSGTFHSACVREDFIHFSITSFFN